MGSLNSRLPRLCGAILLAFAFPVLALASGTLADKALPEPQGRVILTVDGNISETNRNGTAEFDREMLQALDWREIETFTPFAEGKQAFAGVPLASLLERLGAEGQGLRAEALNDYIVTIPVEDAARRNVLLAMDLDGKAMSVRERGPIWVIYPSDTPTSEDRSAFVSFMVWQLRKLTVQ